MLVLTECLETYDTELLSRSAIDIESMFFERFRDKELIRKALL